MARHTGRCSQEVGPGAPGGGRATEVRTPLHTSLLAALLEADVMELLAVVAQHAAVSVCIYIYPYKLKYISCYVVTIFFFICYYYKLARFRIRPRS